MTVPFRLIRDAAAPRPTDLRPNSGAQGFYRSLMEEMRTVAAGDGAADQNVQAAWPPGVAG